jgi:hypothetical protein
MKNDLAKKQEKPASVHKNLDEFDFDSWAKQVRPQLLASLQKNSVK